MIFPFPVFRKNTETPNNQHYIHSASGLRDLWIMCGGVSIQKIKSAVPQQRMTELFSPTQVKKKKEK